MQNLSSLTRDGTQAPCKGSAVLAPGPPGKPLKLFFWVVPPFQFRENSKRLETDFFTAFFSFFFFLQFHFHRPNFYLFLHPQYAARSPAHSPPWETVNLILRNGCVLLPWLKSGCKSSSLTSCVTLDESPNYAKIRFFINKTRILQILLALYNSLLLY